MNTGTRLPARQTSYYPRLDGLRAIAVSLVLVHHLGGILAYGWDQGYYGVDLFFVLSGYLITSILVRSGGTFRQAYATFLGRRTLRIFPVYYLALGVIFACGLATSSDLLYLCTYTWNYFAKSHGSPDNQLFYLWSLSVEEQFYLVWPFLVLSLRKRLGLLLCLTTAIVLTGYSQLAYGIFPSMTAYNYTGLVNRMGSLGIGALGAVLVARRLMPLRILHSGFWEFACLAVLVWAQVATDKLRFPAMGVCSLLLVIKCIHGEVHMWGLRQILDMKVVQYVGRISYGIYVYHIPIAVLMEKYVFDPIWLSIPFDEFGVLNKLRWHSWVIKFPLFSGLTVLTAAASFRWIERPLLLLKDMWFTTRSEDAG
ncbi:MAG: acyltransferase [Planctomycetaceae bacterium]|nr:acyltransferase [Planctomycetaceae bacterium]